MTGAQVGVFNDVFGINTDYTTVTPLDNQTQSRIMILTRLQALVSAQAGDHVRTAPGLDGKLETPFAPVDQSSWHVRVLRHGLLKHIVHSLVPPWLCRPQAETLSTSLPISCDVLTRTCAANQLSTPTIPVFVPITSDILTVER